MTIDKKLKELKKLATKSNGKIINNKHTIVDSLVIITMSIASMGNEKGMVCDLDRQWKYIANRSWDYLESLENNTNEIELIIELCSSLYYDLDEEKIIIKEPEGYK